MVVIYRDMVVFIGFSGRFDVGDMAVVYKNLSLH